MTECLAENEAYRVELDVNDAEEHVPHKSWGMYRVVELRSRKDLFATRNRDKALGVFEYLSHDSRLP